MVVSRESCIEKLEQFILDENRIITYKVLSQELKMHVNLAKQYLSDFLGIQKSKDVSLQVTYFLAGLSEINGKTSLKILVVSENNLEKEKELFSEVTSCHIYSISKNKLDECSILITERHCNSNIGEINKYSAIKHPTIETKPAILKKISVLNTDTKCALLKKQETAPSKDGSSSFFRKNSNNNHTEKKIVENLKTEITPEEKINEKKENSEKHKVDPKSQKSNPLASMWQKKDDKFKENKSENSKPEVKSKTKSPSGNAKTVVAKNNIMSMFSKQAVKNSEKPKKESVTPVCNKETDFITPKEKSEDSPVDTHNNKESKNKKSKNASTKRKSTCRQSKKSSKHKGSDNESDEEIQPKKKKHRRICMFDDSDSESENEEAQDRAQRSLLESEDPLESPEMKSSPMCIIDDEEPIPPTPPVLTTSKGKKKIWKTVQKTFQDEDGFLVTKQQKEFVSASESDEEDPKPSKTSKDTIKPSVFTYRKQSSLTSFFK